MQLFLRLGSRRRLADAPVDPVPGAGTGAGTGGGGVPRGAGPPGALPWRPDLLPSQGLV